MKQLDLHGTKHSEVKILLDQFLWENMKNNQREVVVITGQSEHMKKIVRDCVDEYMMTCEEDFLNKGKIIIKLI
jgi:DNA-nicking Smr family endonuclease